MSIRIPIHPHNSTIQTALITGASTGIGYELTKLFAADGYRVIMAARDPERLAEAAASIPGAEIVPQDFTVPDAANALLRELGQRDITVDVLVNNAGIGDVASFAEMDRELMHDMLQINVVTLTNLTRGLLPHMIQCGYGRILNLASFAAFVPSPQMSTYSATKAYILRLSESLAAELHGTGVSVTALCPGPVETPFLVKSKLAGRMGGSGKKLPSADPAAVARYGYDALHAGHTIAVPMLAYRIATTLAKLLPRAITARAARVIFE